MSESERNILVNGIEDKGVTDSNVLSALRKVEREKFVPLMMRPTA